VIEPSGVTRRAPRRSGLTTPPEPQTRLTFVGRPSKTQSSARSKLRNHLSTQSRHQRSGHPANKSGISAFWTRIFRTKITTIRFLDLPRDRSRSTRQPTLIFPSLSTPLGVEDESAAKWGLPPRLRSRDSDRFARSGSKRSSRAAHAEHARLHAAKAIAITAMRSNGTSLSMRPR